MKEGYAVVKFDDGVIKVAPFSLVRYKQSKLPFRPASSQDLPTEVMQAKWQKSLTSGDFSGDGFFDVDILLISKTFTTVMEKAKAAGIKVSKAPMIELPSSSYLDLPKIKSRNRNHRRNSDAASVKPSKGKDEPAENPPKSNNKERKKLVAVSSEEQDGMKNVNNLDVAPVKSLKRPNKCKDELGSSTENPQKPNKERKNLAVVTGDQDNWKHGRNSEVASVKSFKRAEANDEHGCSAENPTKPIKKRKELAGDSSEEGDIVKHSSKHCEYMINDKKDKEQVKKQTAEKSEDQNLKKLSKEVAQDCMQFIESDEEETSDPKKPKVNRIAKDPVRYERLSKVASDSLSNPLLTNIVKKALGGTDSEDILIQNADYEKKENEQIKVSDKIGKTTPVRPLSVVGSAHCVSDLEDDSIFPLVSAFSGEMTPKKNTPSFLSLFSKPEIKQTGEQYNVQKEEKSKTGMGAESTTDGGSSTSSESDEDDMDSTLPVDITTIPVPSSSSDSSNSSSSSELAGKLVETKGELKKTKEKLVDTEAQLVLANNLRIKYLEKNESLEKEIKKLRKRNEQLQDLLVTKRSTPGMTSKVSEDEHQEASLPKAMKRKVSEDEHQEASLPKAMKRKVSEDEDLEAPCPKKISKVSTVQQTQKKRRSRDKNVDLKDPELVETCSKVLGHLSRKQRLTPNEDGDIDIGNNILVKKEPFEKNFASNKLDVVAATRNLASLLWTKPERMGRSLEGSTNNKNAAESKIKATPTKVMTVLGALKAHMLHQGDVEDPRMAKTLYQCRQTIGTKFAQDAYNSTRTVPVKEENKD